MLVVMNANATEAKSPAVRVIEALGLRAHTMPGARSPIGITATKRDQFAAFRKPARGRGHSG